MKRLITALLIVSGLCSPFLLSAQDSWQSLINRLTYYSPEKYKSAIDNLKKKYPDSYHPDKDWEKALSELKTDKETLISGLKAKDPKAEKQAKKLLKQLDAALLANPLLADKQVVAIRRTLGDKARTAMSGQLGIAPSNFQNNSEIGNPKAGWTNEFVSLTVNPDKKNNLSCTNRKTEKSSPIRNHTSTGKNLCFLPLVPPTAGICSNST